MKPLSSENKLLVILGSIAFIVMVDFMMVMPLGPDFANALGIPANHIGFIGGSYTLAACISGLVAALFIDNFDRKKAIIFCFIGLIISTFLACLSWDSYSMIFTRLLAGAFGGPIQALGVAMISDFIPPERRGAAMGKYAGSFALASVLGVPFGLELASLFSWKAPFIFLSVIGIIVLYFANKNLPNNSNKKQILSPKETFFSLVKHLKNPTALSTYGFMGLIVFTAFSIIPNISAHVQLNRDYPREWLGLLYFCGGLVSFFTMRIIGKIADKKGCTYTCIIGTALFCCVLLVGFIFYKNPIPTLPIFILFMVATTTRYVSGQTLSSKVPSPQERGGFNSIMYSFIALFQTCGAFMSSQILGVSAEGKLTGMPIVATISLCASLIIPVLFYITEKAVKNRVSPKV
jgi:predicted MFS family arabinose efflux permease